MESGEEIGGIGVGRGPDLKRREGNLTMEVGEEVPPDVMLPPPSSPVGGASSPVPGVASSNPSPVEKLQSKFLASTTSLSPGKMDLQLNNQNTEDVKSAQVMVNLSNTEFSEDILQMIIRSVQKSERKKSAKKTKRKRTKTVNTEANGNEADDERKAYSRCSISFLYQVIRKVHSCPHYVSLVHGMGFGEVLQLDDCCVPRSFVKWIANNVSTDNEEIIIGSKHIQLSPQSISDTFGTPAGALPVDTDEISGKAAFLEAFGLSEVPSIRYFGKKILAKEILPDAEFCRCFMSVCLGALLCPNSSTKISTKYMGALVDVESIKKRNWSKFIHEWLILYIKKFLKEPANPDQLTQTLGGCIYHLAVRCLDFIDFRPIQLPVTLPRIRVWNGNLIKVFSDMYMDTNGKYGAYPVKDLSDTCYSSNAKMSTENVTSDQTLKDEICRAIGDLVGNTLKEAISTSYVTIMKDEDSKVCLKAKELVLEIVQAFLCNNNGSQDTLKLSSSEGTSFKSAINSDNTEILQDEEEDDCDNDHLIHRKRRRTSTQNSDESINKRTRINNSMNQEDAHTEIPNTEGTIANEVTCSQRVQSASLDHMVLEKNQSEKYGQCGDVSSKEFVPLKQQSDTIEASETLMDLNIKCVREDYEEFQGFDGPIVKDLNKNDIEDVRHGLCSLHEQPIDAHKQDEVHCNLPASETLSPVEYCAVNIHKDVSLPTVPIPRSQILENARSKYFWKDEGIPRFRLFDDVDDNGRTIDEPEFHRPLEMDDYSYNEKCEMAILKCKEKENELLNIENKYASPSANQKANASNSKDSKVIDINDNDFEMTIQCAQRQPSKTGLTNSSSRPLTGKRNFVDLVSPVLTVTSQDHESFKQSSSSDKRKPDYGRAVIIGRRLFEGSDEDWLDSNSKNKSPVREFLNNFGNVQEVEVLQERTFRDSCNQMRKQTDDLYNASLSLGSSNSSFGKENFLPQRIPQRSRYVCSPFDVNPSENLSVKQVEREIWEAVTTLCDIEEHKTMWAVYIDKVRVSMLQLGSSMKINGKLEAWLMNAFCRKFFRDNHPRITMKHFFFNTVSDYFLEKWKNEDAKNYMHKQAIKSFVGANQAKELHESDGLYFPTVHQDHWFVFLVDMKYRNFIWLDSWYGKDSTYHKQIQNLMIKNFQKTWVEARLHKVNFQSFGRAYPNVPRQEPGNDCGIFALKYMELFIARNPTQCAFSHLDIPNFRIKYAHDILMSDHNEKHEAKFLATGFHS